MKAQPNRTNEETFGNVASPAARGPVRRRRGLPPVHDLNEVYGWIVQYKIEHNGNSPSLRDIMRGCHITSNSVAFSVLQRLEKKGRIRLAHRCGVSRSIEVPGGRWVLDKPV